MKKAVYGAMTVVFCLLMSVIAYAGQWKQDDGGWWYQNEDGSYPAAEWKWIDSDGDGVAECYYFYSDGYMAYNNDIENRNLNDDGQWVINDKVQQRIVSKKAAGQNNTVPATYGRDFSYVKYLQRDSLIRRDTSWTTDSMAFNVYVRASRNSLIDLGDCYEIKDVSVYLPYEYATKKEAETVLMELSRENSEFQGGYVERQANGKYHVFAAEDDYEYSYKDWMGSIYIRKDAKVSFSESSGRYVRSLVNEIMRRARRGDDYGILCVIDDIDENGYVTKLLEAQWG